MRLGQFDQALWSVSKACQFKSLESKRPGLESQFNFVDLVVNVRAYLKLHKHHRITGSRHTGSTGTQPYLFVPAATQTAGVSYLSTLPALFIHRIATSFQAHYLHENVVLSFLL